MNIAKVVLCATCSFAFALGCDGRRPLPTDSVNPRIVNASDHGLVSRDMTFDLVVGVQLRNTSALAIASRDFNDVLQPSEFGDLYGATPGDYAKFVGALQADGFEIVRTTPSRSTVTVRGNADAIKAAFGVDMHNYEDRWGLFTAAASPIAIRDASTLGLISGVVGLDGVVWANHLATPNAGTGSQTPSDFESRYGENVTTITNPGQGQTVAILSTNYKTLTTDLNSYLTKYKPAGVTTLANNQYTSVDVGGPLRDMQDANVYVENVLDAEMVLATAPFANIVQIFTATNGAGLFTDGISYIVNNVTQAHTVTVSWGTCERGSASSMPVMNALFAQAKAEGQQWFFAAGDTGTDGCRDSDSQSGGTAGSNKIFSAGWPASSPYVLGIGGTQVATATTEATWTGGGGGISESFDKPAYQMGVTVVNGTTTLANDNARDEPDFAAQAGNVAIVDSVNGASAVGGTSAATPICAGLWAVLVQQKAPMTGIKTAHESIYTLGKAGKGFTDITTGATIGPGEQAGGGYTAGTGYDLATGWGTPNLTSLIANWQ